jgi:transformation/transcription domain-associated protein
MDGLEWTVLVSRVKGCKTATADLEQHLNTLRTVIETMTHSQATPLLQELIPWLVSAMTQLIPPSLDPSDQRHKCRLAVLRCVARIVSLEDPVKSHLPDICSVLMDCLAKDSEECALLTLHVIIDLQKTFRHLVEPMVPAFLDFVVGLLDRFDAISKFQRHDHRQCPSRSSLKVVLECPVIVVLIFQLHRRHINDYIGRFVPVVMRALAVTVPSPGSASASADQQTNAYPPTVQIRESHPKSHYCDFMSAKIKILSFFAYISRGFIAAVRQSANDIPQIVIDLLRETPMEIPSARKELLVATRHILSTELRSLFVPHIGTLLDERLLLGDGWTCQLFFRPLAYSLLADLVHHVRMDLSQKHLVQVINLFCRLLSDPSLPAGIQSMSAKLLLNLIDPVMVDKVERPLCRILLYKTLSALLFRVTCLARLLESDNGLESVQSTEKSQSPFYTYPQDPLDLFQLVVNSDSITTESWREGPKEFKFLFKTILGTMKAVILSLKTLQDGVGSADTSTSTAPGMSLVEAQSFVTFFADGLQCLKLLSSHSTSPLDPRSSRAFSVSAIPTDEKELLDQFAYVFTLLDTPHFYDVVERAVPGLVTAIRHNFALLAIPQYFLAIAGLSRHFSSILARFLVDRLSVLGSTGTGENEHAELDAAIHLRLFKLLFLSVSVYPEENEPVLQPLVGDIIMQCLRGRPVTTFTSSMSSSSTAVSTNTHSHSIHYFYLLRSLFRSIGGGRFESLYKEVLPLLPLILEELNRLIFDRDMVLVGSAAGDQAMSSSLSATHREVYVELCLTVPVRLSVLLPYLPLLMRPLVLSLNSSNELIGQGLRTLELCVDNLTQDFLDPVLTPIADDLQKALWRLLQPSPNIVPAHAQVAMRILGKLGGRSRRLGKLQTHPLLAPKPSSFGDTMRLELDLGTRQRGLSIDFDADFCAEHAASILSEPSLPANLPFIEDAVSVVRYFLLNWVSKLPPRTATTVQPQDYNDCAEPVEEGARHRQLMRTCLLSMFRVLDGPTESVHDPVKQLLSGLFGELLSQFRQLEGVRSGLAVVEDARMLSEVLIVAASMAPLETSRSHLMAQQLIEEKVLVSISYGCSTSGTSAVSPVVL